MLVLIHLCLYPSGGFGASSLLGGDQGFLRVASARVFASLLVRSVIVYSFTYLAYSSRGTFSFLAIATCEGDNLTVLRPCFLREAEVSAGATLALPPFARSVVNLSGNKPFN